MLKYPSSFLFPYFNNWTGLRMTGGGGPFISPQGDIDISFFPHYFLPVCLTLLDRMKKDRSVEPKYKKKNGKTKQKQVASYFFFISLSLSHSHFLFFSLFFFVTFTYVCTTVASQDQFILLCSFLFLTTLNSLLFILTPKLPSSLDLCISLFRQCET